MGERLTTAATGKTPALRALQRFGRGRSVEGGEFRCPRGQITASTRAPLASNSRREEMLKRSLLAAGLAVTVAAPALAEGFLVGRPQRVPDLVIGLGDAGYGWEQEPVTLET